MTGKDKIQGEGNYDAARKFDDEERAFVKKGPVEQKAREEAEESAGRTPRPKSWSAPARRVASAAGTGTGS